MRLRYGVALLGAAVMVSACSSSDGGSASFATAALGSDEQKASYGIGINVGNQIRDTKDRLDRMAFMRGIEDALQGAELAVEPEELQTVLQAFAAEIQAAAAAEGERLSADNIAAGDAYRAENGAKEGVITTDSGLQYEVLRQGDGAMPGPADRALLHYKGTLIDGTEFDSSYDGDPAEFGVGGVIGGFSEALQLMAVGSHFRIVIPPELGYGPQGSGPNIGPNATLIFELELLEILGGQ